MGLGSSGGFSGTSARQTVRAGRRDARTGSAISGRGDKDLETVLEETETRSRPRRRSRGDCHGAYSE
ncbi:hypothetical protein EA472_05850 [Natrarchaeobius oligotrophus]|uniref:Uncharacterized protein n=1 Tax=Natrarchaeobius chitinivorans TaxID=1679083 RepID=A0A3N6N2H5_NATCH|nr:hypothetical protein EA472_05850 [Natrarchaeobius chitinivorans]